MGFLRLGQFCISLFQYLLEEIDFISFLIEIPAKSKLSLLRFFGNDSSAFELQLLLDVLIEGLFGFLQ